MTNNYPTPRYGQNSTQRGLAIMSLAKWRPAAPKGNERSGNCMKTPNHGLATMTSYAWFRWQVMHIHMTCYLQAVHHERMLSIFMPFNKFSWS